MALVDNGALPYFVSETLVAKFGLLISPGDGMKVVLTDGSRVEVSQTCCIPLVVCFGDY